MELDLFFPITCVHTHTQTHTHPFSPNPSNSFSLTFGKMAVTALHHLGQLKPAQIQVLLCVWTPGARSRACCQNSACYNDLPLFGIFPRFWYPGFCTCREQDWTNLRPNLKSNRKTFLPLDIHEVTALPGLFDHVWL